MHEEDGRRPIRAWSRQGQERRQIQHVCRQQQVWAGAALQKMPGQGNGTPMHAPLPEACRQGKKSYLVCTVTPVALSPCLVAAAMIGRDEGNLHRSDNGWRGLRRPRQPGASA